MIVKLIRVNGLSLEPLLKDGQVILAVGLRLCLDKIRPGDVVIFTHPSYGQMVKLVQRFSPNGEQVWVTGTAPTSLDSLEFGPIPRGSITGKVVRLKPA